MADVATRSSPLFLREVEIMRGVELLFFGYTSLLENADRLLAEHRLGRAHHRALYFIGRQGELPVSELLKLLRITKQSLSRVVHELQDRALVRQRPGSADRRQRLLSLTDSGRALERELFAALQGAMSAAYLRAGQQSVAGFWEVLSGLIPPDYQDAIRRLRDVA